MKAEAEHAKCALEVRAEAPVVASCDRERIDQAVTNLLSNAIKYGAGKPIELSVGASAGRAVISARDHGMGIAPEDMARLFSRFERAVPVRRYGGLGLGLYITRQIVEGHGGTVRAESKPGEGARFVIELPLEK